MLLSVSELRDKVATSWRSGRIAKAALGAIDGMFPLEINLGSAGRRAFDTAPQKVIEHAQALKKASTRGEGGFLIKWQTIRPSGWQSQTVPRYAVFTTPEMAAAFLGNTERTHLRQLLSIAEMTASQAPALLPLVQAKPFLAIKHAAKWGYLLDVVRYFRDNPRPGVGTREIAVPGIDTKFIENNKKILDVMLSWIMPEEALDRSASGVIGGGFEQRHGLVTSDPLIRFRLIDPDEDKPFGIGDFSVPSRDFHTAEIPCDVVIVCENKRTFETFPAMARGIVVWGQGRAVTLLRGADWLRGRRLIYWGDIDTHGLSILSHLRSHFPHAESMLMDRETLLAHRHLWANELDSERCLAAQTHLNRHEGELLCLLISNEFGINVRFEQEWVNPALLQQALANLELRNRGGIRKP